MWLRETTLDTASVESRLHLKTDFYTLAFGYPEYHGENVLQPEIKDYKRVTAKVYLQRWHGWCHMKLLPSRCKFCVHHTTCHFMQSHMRKAYACLAVTCHLRFWQNDRGLLRATAVTRGWNGYRNKSQHTKLTLEKKILPPLLQGFEPATFQTRVRRSDH